MEHRRHKGLNNRAENSHRPVRRRERVLQRFKSPGHAQRFLEPFSAAHNHFRCEEVQRQLARCGLAVRRLESTELAQLYYACWCPELARVQRLRGQLDDYTSLVLRAADGWAATGGGAAAGPERRPS